MSSTGNGRAQPRVHLLDDALRHEAGADVRLIGRDDDHEAGTLQVAHGRPAASG